jgi:hypothetical protein
LRRGESLLFSNQSVILAGMKKSLLAALLALGSVGVLSLTHNPVSAQQQQPKGVTYLIKVVPLPEGIRMAKEGWQCVGTFPSGGGHDDRLVMQKQF